MYKEYKFQDPTKAAIKQQKFQQEYGYKIPIYKIQSPSGQEFFSIVYPVGLQPKKRK